MEGLNKKDRCLKKKFYRPEKSAGVSHKDRDKIIPRREQGRKLTCKGPEVGRLSVPGALGG